MSAALAVFMNGHRAGTIRQSQGRLRLDYEDEYATRPDATPLSLSLPVELPRHSHASVDAFLWGLLPDNEAVQRRWARQFNVSSSSAFALLGTPVGEDCPGAVQLVPDERAAHWRSDTGYPEWLTEQDVADRLRVMSGDETDWLGTGPSAGQFSLAGAQSKTALYQADGQWAVPHGRMPTTHILKPSPPRFPDLDLNEHLCMTAARHAGLTAAHTHVVQFADQRALVVTRFDRLRQDGRVLRVHQEDMCQALSIPPRAKYQMDGGPTPRDVVGLLRRALRPEHADEAVEQFVDALALNWLIAGTDAHGKNYGLLLSAREIRLAPLYDVASMLPYEPDPLQLKLAMKLGGEYRLKNLTRRNWEKLAGELGLDREATVQRVEALAGRLPDALSDACGDAAIKEYGSPLPSRLLDLITHRVTECQRSLLTA